MTRAIGLFFVALVALGSPAFAQLMGATELKVSVPVKGAASAKPVADIYYLAGESGAKETYKFAGKGPASLTLFGPDGSEILTASGVGILTLEVVLPFTDVFTIAVARKNPALAYTLSRKAIVPTLEEAFIAKGAGYTDKCWLIPGVKMRRTYENGFEDVTLAVDRHSLSFVSKGPLGIRPGEVSISYSGTRVHQRTTFSGGGTRDVSFEFTPEFDLPSSAHFNGYLCQR